MNKLAFVMMITLLAPLAGCSYGTAVAIGQNRDRVLILRNDNFLFGAIRRAYVCLASDAGLVECKNQESP
jgi:hypothetical protein